MGKYFDGHEPTYLFHLIEHQYCGLPHAHLVAPLDGANDIDDPNCEDLINFVNRHFAAEMPRFDGEEFQKHICGGWCSCMYGAVQTKGS
jgi:hypothetical protein